MIGSQEPRIQIEPQRATSDGNDAALLMSEYGYNLDPWQKLVLDCWLGRDENGKYNVTSAGLALPRQNGKNVCLEAREFFGLLVNGERILHTAHQVRTAKKSFRRLAAMFTDKKHPEITDQVEKIRYTNGEECIELKNGGVIEFSARSRQAARGFDGISLVVFDEAQELTDDQLEAIMATLSASATGNRQLIYTGTPPYPGCLGTVFGRRRKTCLTDHGKHDCWHEWSVGAEKLDDIKLDDRSLWYMVNPALGLRLDEEFTAEEFTSMSPDGFARERLGWWAPEAKETVNYAIDHKLWEKCKSKDQKPEGKTAYGVRFCLDGSEVVLCGAVIDNAGFVRISEIKREPTAKGIRWLSEWLKQRYSKACCVIIDGKNGADLLVHEIQDVWKAPMSIIRPTANNVISAASHLTNAINENELTWYEGQEDLNESALTVTKRPIGGGFGFGGENAIPIEGCALALWGAKNSKRDPTRKMRIG